MKAILLLVIALALPAQAADPRLVAAMQDYLRETRSMLPRKLSPILTWDRVEAQGLTITGHYHFSRQLEDLGDLVAFHDGLRGNLLPHVCKTSGELLHQGVTFGFIYRAVDGRLVTIVAIKQADCEGNVR